MKRYNDALRLLARDLDLPLVDVHAAYPGYAANHHTSMDRMLLDGMHPSDLGHEMVAEKLLPVIRQQLQ